MAGFALNFGDRIVSTGLQKFHPQGRVGVMTAGAGGLGHRIVSMGFLEGGFGALMAGQTERGFRFFQEVRLVGTV